MCRFVFLFLLLCVSEQLVAQTSEADIASRLLGKPLYLRCLCGEDKLAFDSKGKPGTSAGQSSFTLSGVDVDGVRLEGQRLVLDGRRVGLDLSHAAPERVALQQRSRWSPNPHDERMHLEIVVPPDGDFREALDASFTEEIADLAPGMSSAWRTFAREHFGAQVSANGAAVGQTDKAAEDEEELHTAEKTVTPPRLIRSGEAKFPKDSRPSQVVVSFRVDKQGQPKTFKSSGRPASVWTSMQWRLWSSTAFNRQCVGTRRSLSE